MANPTDTYRIIRLYKNKDAPRGTVIKTGLTRLEAQAHCKDPEMVTLTHESEEGKALTETYGPWTGCYQRETHDLRM